MKNTLVLLIAKIFEKGIMFLFFVLLAQHFGKTTVGEFSYYYSIVLLLFVLLDMGGEFYQIKEFSKNENLRKFTTIFVLKSLIFIILFALSLVFFYNIYFLILLASYYIMSMISIFKSSMYIHNQYILDSKYIIYEKTFFIVLILFNTAQVKQILLIYFAFLLSKLFYLFLLFNKFYKIKYIFKSATLFDKSFAIGYTRDSWSYILHSFLVVVFVQVDIIMLKMMNISFADIGLYAVAIKVYAIAIIFADILFKQYYPIVAYYIQHNQQDKLKKIMLKVQSTNLFFSIYFLLFVGLFAKEIIFYGFGDEFVQSGQMLLLLSMIIVFRFSMYTYTAILSASNLNYIKLYTSVACTITNIVLNYFLIPIYGVYGAIVATVITEFLLVILYKASSSKIIFLNNITIQEIFILIASSITIYVLYNYNINMSIKASIFIFLCVSLAINYKNITEKISFKRE